MALAFGMVGLVSVLFQIALLVIFILVIVAVFRIRNATEKTAQRLDEIYHLLKNNQENH